MRLYDVVECIAVFFNRLQLNTRKHEKYRIGNNNKNLKRYYTYQIPTHYFKLKN